MGRAKTHSGIEPLIGLTLCPGETSHTQDIPVLNDYRRIKGANLTGPPFIPRLYPSPRFAATDTRHKGFALTLLVLLGCLLLAGINAAAAHPAAGGAPTRYVPGEILISYHDGVDSEALHAATRARAIDRPLPRRWQRLALPPGLSVEEAIAHYRRQPEVRYAEPNYLVHKAETFPDDPDFAKQWALENIQAPLAWDHTQGSEAIIIAIVDTGIFYKHPDLAANLWVDDTRPEGDGRRYGCRFENAVDVDDCGDPLDDDSQAWHGTHLAGIAGAEADNARGIAGVNWRVALMAVKVLHEYTCDGNPCVFGRVSDIITGIHYAIEKGAHIVNLSLGFEGYSLALEEALKFADQNKVLVVSAAGNFAYDNDTQVVGNPSFTPANIRTPNNIAVAALTRDDELAGYSNYGRLSVDLAAPGGDCRAGDAQPPACDDAYRIYSTAGTTDTEDFDHYRYAAGTSMATPHVAGVAALVMAHRPDLSHHQVKARLLNGARPRDSLATTTLSGGTLDAHAAIQDQEELPAVFHVSPAHACLGQEMVITGINFGQAHGEIYVEGLDSALVPTSWLGERDGVADKARLNMVAAIPLDGHYRKLWINGVDNGTGFFIQRSNCLPVVSLSIEPQQGRVPLKVTLRADAHDEDGEIERYDWDLGDGQFNRTTVEPTLQHTFETTGTFTLRVRAWDNDGGNSTAVATLVIRKESSSDCFIATAAWGSPLEEEVMTLRRFRDRYLLDTATGRAVVDAYYRHSPPLADAIRERPWARAAVRALLRPLVAVASWVIGDAEAGSGKPRPLEAERPATPPAEYLVGFVSGTTEEAARAIIIEAGGTLRHYRADPPAHGLALFEPGHPEEAILSRLLAHPAIRYAEPNRIVPRPAPPNGDP
jgi:subtilisin family serine protease/PKD repeat protein